MEEYFSFNRKARIAVPLFSFVIYIAEFGPIYARTGEAVTTLTLVPIAVSAWFLGMTGALLAALICVPINLVLLNLEGASGLQHVFRLWPAIVGSAAVGIILGILSDAMRKLREQTRELEVQRERLEIESRERERTRLELAEANQKLEYDFRELQRVDEALRENQRILSTLLSNLPGMAYRCINDHLWTMEFVSHGCLALTGYSPEHLVGNKNLSYNDLVHAEDRVAIWEIVQAALAGRRAFQLTYRIVSAEGKIKWVWEQGRGVFDEQGTLVAIEGFISDISEHKQAEEELVRLGTAIEQAAEAIFVTDAEWIIRYVNPAFERLTGYSGREIIGQHTRTLRSYKHESDFYKKMRETLARGEVWSGRIVNRRKDGAFYDAEVTASPVRDKPGSIINYVNIHRDVSKEVRLERELLQARKMEAIGTLAGGIAHDFNNILGIITGYTELAMSKSSNIPGLTNDLTRVKEAALRAADLIKQILTYSRRRGQEQRPLLLVPIVTDALRLLRSVLPATIQIRQEILIESMESAVLSNPTEIHQILMNLCTNAAHAMQAQGGILNITLWDASADSEMAARYSDSMDDSHVCLSVKDTGHGMAAGLVERIFDPFFTTKAPGEGTGLGLSVVHGIVTGLGGKIVVDTELGVGTTFHLFFPRIKDEIPLKPEETGALPTGTERILFIDDEASLTDLGKEMLESLGYKVTAKTDPVQAFEIFRERPDAFDLVITDMTMPHLTGADIAGECLKIRPGIPVILLTGFSENMSIEKAKSLGIPGFLMKPVTAGEIANLIRKVLDRVSG